MATLPNIKPTYSSSKAVQPRILRADFGDGYVQRTSDGINTQKDMWTLEWTLNATDATTLINFFIARDGYDSFDWTPIGESTSKKFICPQWSKSFLSEQVIVINATFEEVFDS